MSTADLSVVLANYHHARYLPRALDAILGQSLRPREIVVIDDASSQDNSVEVLEDYARREPSIRLFRNETNLGVPATYNRGIALAQCEYVLLAAADDYILPGFVEKSFGILGRHPQAGLCFTYDSFRFDDGPVEPNPSGWCNEPGYFAPDDVCRNLRHCIPGHAVICRRDSLVQVGGYRPDLAWYADWFAFVTVAFRQGACHVPETLAVRVLCAESYSAHARQGEENIAVLAAFLELMRSPEFADVAPYFRRNGAATYFGTDLVRAAARRADHWDPDVLGFVNGFRREQYEELLGDPDPAVCELAEFFLGPFWRAAAERRLQREAEMQRLRDEIDTLRTRIPPPGAAGKIRWLAGLVKNRLRGAAG